MRTWHIEILIVAFILSGITLFFQNDAVNWITTIAILFTFNHGQIGDRLQEREKAKQTADVHCYWKLNILFASKELLWIIAFLLMKNYAAIVGSVMFFFYPMWRKYYRQEIKRLTV